MLICSHVPRKGSKYLAAGREQPELVCETSEEFFPSASLSWPELDRPWTHSWIFFAFVLQKNYIEMRLYLQENITKQTSKRYFEILKVKCIV